MKVNEISIPATGEASNTSVPSSQTEQPAVGIEALKGKMKNITPKSKPISGTENLRKTKLEKTIQAGKQHFIAVGEALAEIKETKLYRDEYKTFEAYCQGRWQFSRQYAGQLILAAEVAKELPENCKPGFTNSKQLIALSDLPKEDRAAAADVIIEKAKKRGRPVTTKDVEAVVHPAPPATEPTEPSEAPTDADIEATTSITPGVAQADAQSEAGERMAHMRDLAGESCEGGTEPEIPPTAIFQAIVSHMADSIDRDGPDKEIWGPCEWEAWNTKAKELLDRVKLAPASPRPPDPEIPPTAAIATVADALAFCRATDEPGHNWEAAATILVAEVDRLTTALKKSQADLYEKTFVPDTSLLTPTALLKELQKAFKPRIPNTLPQAERAQYGEVIQRMVKWLMNPVDANGNPVTATSAYTS